MANFMFENPTQIHFGKNVENKIGGLCKMHCVTDTVMVVSYESSSLTEIVQRIIENVKAEGLKVVEYYVLIRQRPLHLE